MAGEVPTDPQLALAGNSSARQTYTRLAAEHAAGRRIGEAPAPRYVTASLHVEYLKPTPLGTQLEIRSRVKERTDRKAVVSVTVSVAGVITVRGEVVAVRIPSTMGQPQS